MFRWLKSSEKNKNTKYEERIQETEVGNVIEDEILKEEISEVNPFARGAPSKGIPPKSPGSYRIVDNESREILYIGVTNNLYNRRYQHEYSGRFTPASHSFCWKILNPGSSIEDLYEHERQKIKRHNPKGNISRGGNGRRGNLSWDKV